MHIYLISKYKTFDQRKANKTQKVPLLRQTAGEQAAGSSPNYESCHVPNKFKIRIETLGNYWKPNDTV